MKFFILLFLLLPICGISQDPYHIKLRSIDGLGSENVYCSYKDNSGFMWFGTDVGVSRFNGYEFDNFDASNGMLGNEIFTIYQDNKGRIWFLSLNGKLSYFYRGKFYNELNDSLLSLLVSESHWSSILEDPITKDLFISSTSNGIYRINELNQVIHIAPEQPFFNLWKTSDNELIAIGPSRDIFKVKNDRLELILKTDLVSNYTRSMYTDSAAYIGHGNILYLFSDSLQFITELDQKSVINWVSETPENEIIIGTRKGIVLIDPRYPKTSLRSYFNNSIITSTYFDRDGSFWVTTLGEGIFLCPNMHLRILSKELNDSPITALNWDSIKSELWVGQVHGRYASINNNTVTRMTMPDEDDQPIKRIRQQNDTVLICGKAHLAIEKDKVSRYLGFLANDIIIEEEQVYFASNKLYKFDLKLLNELIDNPSITNKEIENAILPYTILPYGTNVICKGWQGTMYFGTRQGLFAEKNNELIDLSILNSQLETTINDLVYDKNNKRLFVATNNAGVIVLEKDHFLCQIDENTELSSNNCLSLDLDSNGDLWIGTSIGVDKIILNNEAYYVSNFSKSIGIAKSKFSDIEITKENIYLGADYGLVICDNIGTRESRIDPPTIFVQSVLVNSIPQDTALLNFDYTENSITFLYQGMCLRDLGNLTYAYRLEGYQNSWKLTENRSVTFESLNSGKFCFEIKVIDGRGIESEIVKLPFSISPPYWKTYWFWIGLSVIISALIIFLWRFKINRIKQKFDFDRQIFQSELEKSELEKAYLQAEQKAGVLQMNPHFLFNSLNTIKGFYAQGHLKQGNKFLSKFSKLLRKILECSTQFITLKKEIDILTIYLELMQERHDNTFDFSVICKIPRSEEILIPPMLLQPIVENAVIHGIGSINNGEIKIRFDIISNFLICQVEDNGIGFEKSNRTAHESVGLKNIQNRLSLLSQQLNSECKLTIIDQTKVGIGGTLLEVKIPLKKYKNESDNY